MEVVFIRHFPTKGNLLKQYIGRTDQPLDEDYLMDHIWRYRGLYQEREQLVASPMIRCVQTAKVLFPGQEITTCDALRETDFGVFEGKTYEELKDNPQYQAWLEGNGTGQIPKGESREAFHERCMTGFEKLVQSWIGEQVSSVAVVVHGGVIMELMSGFAEEQQDFYYWQVKNGCGFSVQIDLEKWQKGERQFTKIRKIQP